MMTDTLASNPSGVFIRLATLDDLTEIANGALLAFVDDPVMNFFGNVSKVSSRKASTIQSNVNA